MRQAVFFRLRLRLSLQNTAALPTPILSLNLVQRLGVVMALSGVHAKMIQSIMRHKDVKLTLEPYGHLFQSMEREALDKLGQLTA